MRNKLIFVFVLLAVLTGAFSAFAQESAEPVVQSTTVHNFDGSEVEGGFARLTRYENGATVAFNTSNLVAGDVYTVWWVIFNDPQNCSNGACDLDDIFAMEDGSIPRDDVGNRVMNMDAIAQANISVQHASGALSVDGSLSASASLSEGIVPGIVFGPGLIDSQSAEIHLVVRTHGPLQADAYADQLSTFGGGCEPMDAAPCDDVQYAIFMPVSE